MGTKHYSSNQDMLTDLGYTPLSGQGAFSRNHNGTDQVIPVDWFIGRTPDAFRGWLSYKHPEFLEPQVVEPPAASTQSVPPVFPDFNIFMGAMD